MSGKWDWLTNLWVLGRRRTLPRSDWVKTRTKDRNQPVVLVRGQCAVVSSAWNAQWRGWRCSKGRPLKNTMSPSESRQSAKEVWAQWTHTEYFIVTNGRQLCWLARGLLTWVQSDGNQDNRLKWSKLATVILIFTYNKVHDFLYKWISCKMYVDNMFTLLDPTRFSTFQIGFSISNWTGDFEKRPWKGEITRSAYTSCQVSANEN